LGGAASRFSTRAWRCVAVTTLIGAMLPHKGEGDGLICGTSSTTARHLHYTTG
jgi:phosphotransacetylase